MSVNWTSVKAKLLRRKIVDVQLPKHNVVIDGNGIARMVNGTRVTADDTRCDREADCGRRQKLQADGHKVEGDRHEVRELYRGLYGQP